ncbi:MAG: hypothetical protein ACD_17C00029G0001 [uncultured bacterium]|nr:MAG: hypothetical protein ACD_17C00029G0001 [uncultured bacterium]
MQKVLRFLYQDPAIYGPLFLLSSLVIATPTVMHVDLFLTAAIGFVLSWRWHVRGFCYALVLLGITSIVKHAFLSDEHLWFLGVEGSLALAFFITALTAEQGAQWVQSLESQIAIGKTSCLNLEEALSKFHEETGEQQIAYQEKIALVQKELEELRVEHSSILVLNEVLRKKTKEAQHKSQEIAVGMMGLEAQFKVLQGAFAVNNQELERLLNADTMAALNKQLLEELNETRFDKEQAHLTNEVFRRQHRVEELRAQDALDEVASLKELLSATHEQVRKVEGVRKAQEDVFQKEKTELLQQEAAQRALLEKERHAVTERESAATRRIAELETSQGAERLQYAEGKMAHLSALEPLYKQLKKQFEEKSTVLEETRRSLFLLDTELQGLKMDRSALEMSPLAKEMDTELETLAQKILDLEEENQELQELVTLLTKTIPQKKK